MAHSGLAAQASLAYNYQVFSDILDRSGPYLSAEGRSDAVNAGYAFLHQYAALASAALSTCRPNYKIRLKWHAFHHTLASLDAGCTLNPRLWSCWLDEAFVGRMCRAARGVHPQTVGRRCLQRWSLEMIAYHDQRSGQAQ